jgi:hypothetical protein
VQFLRVTFWAISRSSFSLSTGQISSVFELFELFQRANLTDDCNLLEPTRLVRILHGAVSALLEDVGRFAHIVFGGRFSAKCAGAEFFFVEFFATFSSFLESHPEKLSELTSHPDFASVFRSGLQSKRSNALSEFSRLTQLHGIDTSFL